MKLSDALVLDARMVSAADEQSIAGQVEFWARLGRAIEPLLLGNEVLALCQNAIARPLSECLEAVDTSVGHERVRAYLETIPFPHYQAVPEKKGWLLRIEADGSQVVGRFVNREFVPEL